MNQCYEVNKNGTFLTFGIEHKREYKVGEDL